MGLGERRGLNVGTMVRIKKGFSSIIDIANDDWGMILEFYDNGKMALVHFGEGKEIRIETYKICSGKIRRTFEVLHKVCRQCNKQFETTSTVALVHPGCRKEWYNGIKRRNYEKRVQTPSRITNARGRYFINEAPCSSCGLLLLTKKRRFFNEVTNLMEEHYLCPLCLAMVRCGFMEPITWKQIDRESAHDPRP